MEKRWATPDQYPLSLNALVAACNQRNNRDPVLDLQEFEVTGCLLELREKGLVFIREREGGRVPRYAERLTEELTLDRLGSAVLAELMLRGPQTAPELARRAARMAPDASPDAVEATLADLARTRLVMLQARKSGQRHARWAHLLAAEATEAPAETEPAPPAAPATEPPAPPAAAPPPRPAPAPASATPSPGGIEDLRAEVRALREEVEDLRSRLDRLEG